MTHAPDVCSHPPVRLLLPLLLVIFAAQAGAAPDGRLRLGFEGGVAWYNAFPDELVGPAGVLRLRSQLSDRFIANLGFSHLRQPYAGGQQITTMIPLTLDLRIDRAPLAPFVGGGVAAIYLEGAGFDWGPVLQAGAEWGFSETWALAAQATYTGHRQASVFPYFSSFTVGLSASVL